MSGQTPVATVELLPCPFCGSDDIGKAGEAAWCQDCGAYNDTQGYKADGTPKAHSAWNRRPAEIAALREKLAVVEAESERLRSWSDDCTKRVRGRLETKLAAAEKLTQSQRDVYENEREEFAKYVDETGEELRQLSNAKIEAEEKLAEVEAHQDERGGLCEMLGTPYIVTAVAELQKKFAAAEAENERLRSWSETRIAAVTAELDSMHAATLERAYAAEARLSLCEEALRVIEKKAGGRNVNALMNEIYEVAVSALVENPDRKCKCPDTACLASCLACEPRAAEQCLNRRPAEPR